MKLVLWMLLAYIYKCLPKDDEAQSLKYELLDQGEMITLSLENYFKRPQEVNVDIDKSSPGIADTLAISGASEPIQLIWEANMSVMMGKQMVNLNNQTIIQTKGVYNQPKKIFLLSRNILLVVGLGLNGSSLEALQIVNDTQRCTSFDLNQQNNSLYLYVACMHTRDLFSNPVEVHPFRFNMTKSGIILNLISLKSVVFPYDGCLDYKMFAFNSLQLGGNYSNQILMFCRSNSSNVKNIFFLSMNTSNNNLITKTVPDWVSVRNLLYTQHIIQYEGGFLNARNGSLFEYSHYGKSTSYQNILNIMNYSYIAYLQAGSICYIYIIFQDKIYIKESYSPNHQNFSIYSGDREGMTLNSYAITGKFLALLYSNDTYNKFLVYDLTSIYPKLIDSIGQPHQNTTITLLSVYNYLQTGNYFIVFNITNNSMALKLYQGYQLTIQVKQKQKAVGNLILWLGNPTQSLTLDLYFRGFDDTSIVKLPAPNISTSQQVLRLDLGDYLVAPLASFYSYQNPLSSFQSINYFTQIYAKDYIAPEGQQLLATSLNNLLSLPLISFYYSSQVKTCQVNFNLTLLSAKLEHCQTTQVGKRYFQEGGQIFVLNQGKFLKVSGLFLDFCIVSGKDQIECIFMWSTPTVIADIKVISYSSSIGGQQNIQIFVIFPKQLVYCEFIKKQKQNSFSAIFNLNVTVDQVQQLAYMNISTIYFDDEYQDFLVLHLTNKTSSSQPTHNNRTGLPTMDKVIVYDRPEIPENSSSILIGHVIQQYQSTQIQGVFCIDDLLVMLLRQPNQYVIKEFKISNNYKIRYKRQYPLYGHKVVTNGRHTVNQNFIYIEVYSQGQEPDAFTPETRYYLVYCPYLTTIKVATHKIRVRGSQGLRFVSQIGSVNNNSMGINGDYIFGLSLPSFVLKFGKQSSMALVEFNVSVVDNNNVMTILPFQFTYDSTAEDIQYKMAEDAMQIQFNQRQTSKELKVEKDRLVGPVNTYELVLSQEPSCKPFSYTQQDVFTNYQCLLYYNSKQYGLLQDFISFENSKGEQIEILVTQWFVLVISNRKICGVKLEKQGYGNCQVIKSPSDILMYCQNLSSKAKQIFNLTYQQRGCTITNSSIPTPAWFKYQDFQLQFNGNFIVFQVPIRYAENKIYYKSNFTASNTINPEVYSLLTHQQQEEFSAIDSSLQTDIFLLLQKGIGIYNLSETTDLKIPPLLWITLQNITKFTGIEQPLVYIKLREVRKLLMLVEIGSSGNSYEVEIIMEALNSTSAKESRYVLSGMKVVYQFLQYRFCKNNLNSQSQQYGQIVIKICSYEPQDYFVIANFISISNQSTNNLIQFYSRSGNSSFPFRIEVINSNESFEINQNTLIVGSLFNLICYYQLTPTVSWQISYSRKTQISTQQICKASLKINNQHGTLQKTLTLSYENQLQQDLIWSQPQYYIQRILLLAVLINTIRLWYIYRQSPKRGIRKKLSSKLYSHQFEVMVKVNSKNLG